MCHIISGEPVSSRSLLLIDADPAVHQLLTTLLQRADRSIQDVYDGSEALALLRRSPCDLVLAGQGRNGFDNLKLLRRVRALLPKTKDQLLDHFKCALESAALPGRKRDRGSLDRSMRSTSV